MPSRLSKFTIDATCKEYVHPWSDSCALMTVGYGLAAVKESFKMYSKLYFITLLLKGRVPTLNDLKKTFLSILQSTVFLTWTSMSYTSFICLFRMIFGNFNIFTVSYIPSFFSSLTSIILERPSRHSLLALYVSNIATETLFRMAVSRGYARIIPYGQVYIFAVGMTTLLYFFRNYSNNTDSIYKLLRIVLGPYEEKGYTDGNKSEFQRSTGNYKKEDDTSRIKPSKLNFDVIRKALQMYKFLIDKIKKMGGKHQLCPHPHSCVYYTSVGGLKMFMAGLGIQLCFNIVFKMKNLIVRPKQFKQILFQKETFDLAWFIGGFSVLYKLVSCSLRRGLNKDSAENAIIAGLIASLSFAKYPNNTIAIYIVWKAMQLAWNYAAEKGKVPKVKWFSIFLYSISTATLFHAAIVEPLSLRPSYWKFLYNISGRRIATMSRIPIDGFGLESSKQLQALFEQTRTHGNHIFSI